MTESYIAPQEIAEATTLAFLGTGFETYSPQVLAHKEQDVVAIKARGRTGYDTTANCSVTVFEILADVVEDAYYTDHRLGIEWGSGEVIEWSLDTGMLVGQPNEPGLQENTEKTKPTILRVLNSLIERSV